MGSMTPPPMGALKHWRDEAACLDEDPELFFPVGSTGPSLAQIDEAKAVCLGCSVRTACLDWALKAGAATEYGVWGGLDEAELRALKRRNGRNRTAAAATAAEVAA